MQGWKKTQTETDKAETDKLGTMKDIAQRKPNLGGIRTGQGNDTIIWKCNECIFERIGRRPMQGRLAMLHRKTRNRHINCPYCKDKQRDVGKLKIHISQNKCTRNNHKLGQENGETL